MEKKAISLNKCALLNERMHNNHKKRVIQLFDRSIRYVTKMKPRRQISLQ